MALRVAAKLIFIHRQREPIDECLDVEFNWKHVVFHGGLSFWSLFQGDFAACRRLECLFILSVELRSCLDVAEEYQLSVDHLDAVDDLIRSYCLIIVFIRVDLFQKNLFMGRIRQETKSVVNDAEAFNVAILGQGFVATLIVLDLKRWLEVLVWIVLGLISVECLKI